MNQSDSAREILEQSLGFADGDNAAVAAALYRHATRLRADGRPAEAVPFFQRAVGIDERVYGQDHEEVATNLRALAGALRAAGRAEEALPYQERVVAVSEQADPDPAQPPIAPSQETT